MCVCVCVCVCAYVRVCVCVYCACHPGGMHDMAYVCNISNHNTVPSTCKTLTTNDQQPLVPSSE